MWLRFIVDASDCTARHLECFRQNRASTLNWAMGQVGGYKREREQRGSKERQGNQENQDVQPRRLGYFGIREPGGREEKRRGWRGLG